jgi:hypothetical protein
VRLSAPSRKAIVAAASCSDKEGLPEAGPELRDDEADSAASETDIVRMLREVVGCARRKQR